MRTIAFYLPQFHRIPENDAWWGDGFTEWSNVRRAAPQFLGHDQPRKPGELGYYDLDDPAVPVQQSELARRHGVDAFCHYFYWFDGRRLLERPVDAWRSNADLLPYCLSWANESWTRRWDGKHRDVLMPQSYLAGFEERLFDDLLPHLSAPHYVRQRDVPLLVVHRADELPDPRATTDRLRGMARDAGLGGIHLVAAETKAGIHPGPLGFDAVAEFPPVGRNTLRHAQLRSLPGVDQRFRGRLMSYDRLAESFTTRRSPGFVRYRGVAPGWDNTPRRQERATIYVGSTPERFGAWAAAARRSELDERGPDGLVFVNAWNEWAEGAYLEPDARHGSAYLEQLAGRPAAAAESVPVRTRAVGWSLPHVRSIALAAGGSALAQARRAARAVGRARAAAR